MAPMRARHTTTPYCRLLALPESVLQEVISWSPDGATVCALFGACRALRRLRRDPALTALLLVRRPLQHYAAAVSACASCKGGTGAVVQQVAQLVGAGPASGGPFTVPAPLLQALLYSSCQHGDAAAVRALLALPRPPDVQTKDDWALRLATFAAATAATAAAAATASPSHLAVMQVLLEHGADPCVRSTTTGHTSLHVFNSRYLIQHAASSPERLPALRLLLRHCRRGDVTPALDALDCAISYSNLPGLKYLLARLAALNVPLRPLLRRERWHSSPAVLRMMLEHTQASRRDGDLSHLLCSAAAVGALDSVEMLLDVGADANCGGTAPPLLLAVRWSCMKETPERDWGGTVRLLVQRGATVTPAVREAAKISGRSHFLPEEEPPRVE